MRCLSARCRPLSVSCLMRSPTPHGSVGAGEGDGGLGPPSPGCLQGGRRDMRGIAKGRSSRRADARRRGRVAGGRERAGAAATAAEPEGAPDPGHGPARGAAEPDHPGRRLPVGSAEHLHGRCRPQPVGDVGHRAVPHLPQLHERLRGRDPLDRLRHAARSRRADPARQRHDPGHRRPRGADRREEHGPAAVVLRRAHEPAGPRHDVRPRAAELRGRRAQLPRGREPVRDRQPGPQPDPRAVRRSRARDSAHVAEPADAGDLQHLHLRRHRRHAGDDVRRLAAGPADLAARGRPFAGHAGRRVPVLLA